MTQEKKFQVGDRVVYPSHGVGEIIEIESQSIAGITLEVYVISFPQDKMTLKVPVSSKIANGLRPLADNGEIDQVYKTLQGKPKRGNKMWSRRAQEYEAKINSGELVAIAEVVRDLYKNVDSDRSYSERTIYETALNRLVTEIAILEKTTEEDAESKLTNMLKDKLAAA